MKRTKILAGIFIGLLGLSAYLWTLVSLKHIINRTPIGLPITNALDIIGLGLMMVIYSVTWATITYKSIYWATTIKRNTSLPVKQQGEKK